MNKASVSTSKTTRRTKKVVEAAPVEEAAPAPVEEAAPAPVEAAPVEAAPVEEQVSFRHRLESLIQATTLHMNTLKTHVQVMKRLQKEHDLLIKEASKKTKKKKGPRDFTKPRRATGFAEPVIVSDELYSFLVKTKATMKDPSFVPTSQEEDSNWPRVPVVKGTPVARTDVTSHISKYIREHNLQNPEERREIVPDATLRKIFSEPTEVSKRDPSKLVFTYLQLQRYVNRHFPVKQPKV
jgi:hypothetical protein